MLTSAAIIPVGKVYSNQSKLIVSKPDPSLWKTDEINIAWIGHATVLINFFGTVILTDPALLGRVGMYFLGMTWGPVRHTYPALGINELPKPDLVLISHAHMDHMDFETLLELTKRFPGGISCITAAHTKDVIEELDWKSLTELDWEQTTNFRNIKIRAIEVVHNGWRYPGEMDRASGDKEGRSYNGYLIECSNKKIFFAGDTAYTEKFRSLKKERVDIAIIPVGGYVPKYYYHCNPEEAMIMASEFIGAKYFVPIHSKTFETDDEVDKPLIWLEKIKNNYNIETVIDDIGQTFTLRN